MGPMKVKVLMENKEVQLSNAIEQVLVQGNLASLNTGQRVEYYNQTCSSLGLNPLTKPFEYITLNGKLTLYAKKDCTDQLRRIFNVSVEIKKTETIHGVHIVTAKATLPNGRTDESTGAVMVQNLQGDKLANALMKTETKAKRRVTLSVCGLGMLDETETETIPRKGPDAKPVESAPVSPLASRGALNELYATINNAASRGDGWDHALAKELMIAEFDILLSKELTPDQCEWLTNFIDNKTPLAASDHINSKKPDDAQGALA